MAQRNKKHRNNTIAGLFILLSITGFVVVVIMLSDFQGLGHHGIYQIWFKPDTGTPGLSVGSPVTLAGVRIGTVDNIHLEMEKNESFGPRVEVTISVDDRFVVRRDAMAGLVVPVLGTASSINFDGLGTGEPLKDDEYLTGTFAATPILKSAGIGPEEIIAITKTIHNIKNISDNTSEISNFASKEMRESGHEIVSNIRKMVEQVADVVASFREAWPAWKKSADDISQQVHLAATNVNKTIDESKKLISEAHEGYLRTQKTIDDLSPKITKITDNIQSITDTARQEWITKITSALDHANEGIEHGSSLLSSLDETLTIDLPEINRILANMRIASDNLKLSMIEIRAQPWRLFTAPSEHAMQEALLYDLVRTYANAVSDLDASIAELKALHDRFGNHLDPNQDSLKAVLDQLDKNFNQYQDAQNSLYEFIAEKSSDHKVKP